MDKFVTAVSDWPVLVQGAIGSALFWLVLTFGQKATAYASAKFATGSRQRKKRFLRNELIRYSALTAKTPADRAMYTSALWYRASRDLIKGLIWLALGLAFGSIFSILGLVGFLGCIYFLFAALDIVKPIELPDDVNVEITKINEELKKLEDA